MQEMTDVTDSDKSEGPAEGLRERKRKATRQRITEAGIRLFGTRGYDATTLDAIAAEAGISRRTFFHYFKSKDEILLSLQAGIGETLTATLLKANIDRPPLPALRDAMLQISSLYPSEELLVIDQLMLSSEAVQSRKQASYIQDEVVLFAALRRHWPAEDETSLRILAMLCIGLTRVSLDAWRRDGGERQLAEHLAEHFAALEAVLGSS